MFCSDLADQRTQQGAHVEHQRRPARFVAQGLGERRFAAARRREQAARPAAGAADRDWPAGARPACRNALSASRPPRSANVSLPWCSESRPLFLSIWLFSSKIACGIEPAVADQAKLKAPFGLVASQAGGRIEHRSDGSLGQFAASVAMPRAISSSCSRLGSSCSTTTNSFSSSTGICTTGESIDDERAVLLAGG